jgi:hypothetical protein
MCERCTLIREHSLETKESQNKGRNSTVELRMYQLQYNIFLNLGPRFSRIQKSKKLGTRYPKNWI